MIADSLIRVVQKKYFTVSEGERAFYIGRGKAPDGTTPTCLINYCQGMKGQTEESAYHAYLPELRRQYYAQGPEYDTLNDLAKLVAQKKTVTLVCNCNSEHCHASIIKTAVLSIAQRRKERAGAKMTCKDFENLELSQQNWRKEYGEWLLDVNIEGEMVMIGYRGLPGQKLFFLNITDTGYREEVATRVRRKVITYMQELFEDISNV